MNQLTVQHRFIDPAVVNKYAKAAGLFYLFIIVAGICSNLLIKANMVEPGDATVTAANIADAEWKWRLGITIDILMHICDIPVMVILYFLLRPVNPFLALMEILFKAIQSAVLVAAKLNLFTPLFLMVDNMPAGTFTSTQLDSLANIFIRADSYGFAAGLIFFGFGSILLGYLVYHSGYLPKSIGVLMAVAGICYLIHSLTFFLYPRVAASLFPYILIPVLFSELALSIRLVTRGVNSKRWEEKLGINT